MIPRLQGHFPIFGLVFFVLKSLFGTARQWNREKFAILTLKPRSHVRNLIYRTWANRHYPRDNFVPRFSLLPVENPGNEVAGCPRESGTGLHNVFQVPLPYSVFRTLLATGITDMVPLDNNRKTGKPIRDHQIVECLNKRLQRRGINPLF